MKIRESDSSHEVQNLILFILNFFDDLHLQIIESISPEASAENSSAQWAIFLIIYNLQRTFHVRKTFKRKYFRQAC